MTTETSQPDASPSSSAAAPSSPPPISTAPSSPSTASITSFSPSHTSPSYLPTDSHHFQVENESIDALPAAANGKSSWIRGADASSSKGQHHSFDNYQTTNAPLSHSPTKATTKDSSSSSHHRHQNHLFSYQNTPQLPLPCPKCLQMVPISQLQHHNHKFHRVRKCPMERFGCGFRGVREQIRKHLGLEIQQQQSQLSSDTAHQQQQKKVESSIQEANHHHNPNDDSSSIITCLYYPIKSLLLSLESQLHDLQESNRILQYDYGNLMEELKDMRKYKERYEMLMESTQQRRNQASEENLSSDDASQQQHGEDSNWTRSYVKNSPSHAITSDADVFSPSFKRKNISNLSAGALEQSLLNEVLVNGRTGNPHSPSYYSKSSMVQTPTPMRSRANHASRRIPTNSFAASPIQRERPSFQEFSRGASHFSPPVRDLHSSSRRHSTGSFYNRSHDSPRLIERETHSPRATNARRHDANYSHNNTSTSLYNDYSMTLGEKLRSSDDLSSLVKLSQAEEECILESGDQFAWDPSKHFREPIEEFIHLSNDNTTVSNCNRDETYRFIYASAYGDVVYGATPIEKGAHNSFRHNHRQRHEYHEFSIIIDKLEHRAGIRIGFCDAALPLDTYLGQHRRSWALDSSGYIGNDSQWRQYSRKRLQVDDVVTVCLSLDHEASAARIEFRLNEESLGVAFRQIVVNGGGLVPCVNLRQGCQVTLV